MTFPDVVRAFLGTTYRPRLVVDVVENSDTTEPGQRRP